jgi:iron-sulfur cluster repair protein YtfE (RIC family)
MASTKGLWSLIALGAGVGVAMTKLVPVFASMRATGQARRGKEPLARLFDDHRNILSTLDQMASLSEDAKVQQARLLLLLKRRLGKHAMAEEDAVYPMLRRDSREAETKALYDEHADMKTLIYDLEQAIKQGRGWRATTATLRTLIQKHIHEEETILFPQLRARASRAELEELSGLIAREEAMIL